MLDVLIGTLIACGFVHTGYILADWRERKRMVATAHNHMEAAKALVDEYKAHLARLHEVDLTRAQAIADLLRRMEVIEQRYEMEKLSRGQRHA